MESGRQQDFTRGNKFTFAELFECLPSLVCLQIGGCYTKPCGVSESRMEMMQVRRLSSDMISTLAQNIIGNILRLLPIREAIRTSILSSKWRYYWTSIPVVDFSDELFEVSSNSKEYKKYKFVNAIFHVLLLHSGPLLHFRLCIHELNMTAEIDQMILYLSKINTLESFNLGNYLHNKYKLPSSLFSFQRLEWLELQDCVFEPPLTFNGFSKLRILIFYYVEITAKMLQHLLINCPLLESFVLSGGQGDFTEGNKFTFAELFECLPSIVQVQIDGCYTKYLAAGGMPPKLSTPLVHLKIITLDVCFMEQDELSSLLCLIRSSPNLEKIDIPMCDNQKVLVQQTSTNFRDPQDYSSYNLNHLEYLEIEGFRNLPHEVDFVKLIMAKAPVLKEVQIKLNSTASVDEELKILRDLLRYPFPRASPSAKFIIQR